MKNSLKIGLALGMVAISGYGIGRAQAGLSPSAWEHKVNAAFANGSDEDKATVAKAIMESAGNPELTEQIQKMVFSWNTLAQPSDTVQRGLLIGQNQKIIEQNDQIIGLLIKLNDKK